MTKSAGLSSIGGGSSSEKFLGKMDKDFEFAHAAPLKVFHFISDACLFMPSCSYYAAKFN